MQAVSIGQSASLGVLRFMKRQSLERFSFNWSKVGHEDTQPPTHHFKPNILTFQSVSEEDLDYYQCEVKEAGKVVLTVYRALYKDELSKFSVGVYLYLHYYYSHYSHRRILKTSWSEETTIGCGIVECKTHTVIISKRCVRW